MFAEKMFREKMFAEKIFGKKMFAKNMLSLCVAILKSQFANHNSLLTNTELANPKIFGSARLPGPGLYRSREHGSALHGNGTAVSSLLRAGPAWVQNLYKTINFSFLFLPKEY